MYVSGGRNIEGRKWMWKTSGDSELEEGPTERGRGKEKMVPQGMHGGKTWTVVEEGVVERHPGPAVRHLLHPCTHSTVLIPTHQRRRRRRRGSLNIWKQVGGSCRPLTLCRRPFPRNMWSTIVMWEDGSGGWGEEGKGAGAEKTSKLKCRCLLDILTHTCSRPPPLLCIILCCTLLIPTLLIPIPTPHLVLRGTLIQAPGTRLDSEWRERDAVRRGKAKYDWAKTLVREEDEVQKSRTRSTRSENGQKGSSLDSAQHASRPSPASVTI